MTVPASPARGGLLRSALVLGALSLIMLAGPAEAVENGGLGIRPAMESDFFNILLYPGAAIDAEAIVSNSTQASVTLLSYPVDAQSTEEGSFAFGSASEPPAALGSWVQLDADEIVVPAKSELNVPFRLSVPADTPPGDYAGGLIIQSAVVQGETSVADGETAFRVDVVHRQGVRIYLTVAGTAVKSLESGDLSWEQSGDAITFTLPLHNTGNTILQPTATLEVNGWIGANREVVFDQPESLLPGARVELNATLEEIPPIQIGSAHATIVSEAGTDYVRTQFGYAPWAMIGGGVLLLAAGLYGTMRLTRFIRRARHAIAEVAQMKSDAQAAEDAMLPSGSMRHRDT